MASCENALHVKLSKRKLSNVNHAFLNISLLSLHDYKVKLPKFTFYGGREHKTRIFVFKLKIQSFGIQLHNNSSLFDNLNMEYKSDEFFETA